MQYVVTGRVQPERANIIFTQIKWEIPDDGVVIACCDSSQITVVLNLISIDGWATAHIVAEHFAMIVVSALGFSLGSGYSVELIQVTEENGTPHVFGVRPTNPTTNETLGFIPHDPIFIRSFNLANQNLFYRLALRDYIRAINDPIDCPTYCYRAIESIKSAFVFKSGKDQWDEMNNALGTNKNKIETIVKQFADPIRHGNWVKARSTDYLIRWNMLLFTREILLKYLDYELPATSEPSIV